MSGIGSRHVFLGFVSFSFLLLFSASVCLPVQSWLVLALVMGPMPGWNEDRLFEENCGRGGNGEARKREIEGGKRKGTQVRILGNLSPVIAMMGGRDED